MKAYDGVIINGVMYGGLGKLNLKQVNHQLQIIDPGSQVIYNTKQMNDNFLKDKNKMVANDPQAQFRFFYETFLENYAFADLYEVDLTKEYQKYSTLIPDATDAETVYHYMCQLVSNLDDGHVSVSFNGSDYSPCNYIPTWIVDKKQQELLGKVIHTDYIKDYYKFNDCSIRYGTLRKDIGYIIMQGMGMMRLDKTATIKKAMDQIIQELQDIFVYPNSLNFDGNIVILTSGYTISAAETFIQAMISNPKHQVTVIGDTTAGFYSDTFAKTVPGGYEFTLSTERYWGADGSTLEGHGVQPDVYLPISIEDAEKGVDQAFDWILNHY